MVPRYLILVLIVMALSACAAAPTENSAPTPEPTIAAASPTTASAAEVPPTEPAATATTEPEATTPAPTAENSSDTPPELPLPPTSLVEIAPWLTTVAENGNPMEEVRQALVDSMWIESEADFSLVPMRNDGSAVWVVRATRPIAEGEFGNPYGLPGGVFVVDPQAQPPVYEQFGQGAIDSEESFFPSPTVITDTDFTGDAVVDLLFKLTNCGANTCYDEYHIVSYQNSDAPQDVIRATGYNYEGEMVDDLPYALMSYSDVYFGDDSGDSIVDMQLVGGTQGSVGAGPQRSRSETYGWDGAHVVLLLTEYEDTGLRYFKLVDANAAFANAEYDTARTLYDEVITRDDLEELGPYTDVPDERAVLTRYATFRLMLLDILAEDYIGAQTRAEELAAAYPDDIVAQGALQVVIGYAQSNSLPDACAAFTATVADIEPDPVAPLDYVGYSNPEYGAETLCPF